MQIYKLKLTNPLSNLGYTVVEAIVEKLTSDHLDLAL